ncbi:transmembrane channel-like protein 5 isoform X4 [Erpetoichthys calabaricus]|uniref:Transmembrane channel-like protein n=1 Tax=Erpetoichthys calabaricus TaxID=27687 RepID=A0A8C4SNY9_ERPCA|nr:transmembrane channel-like protein 5 isoform X4 [Erpetoichthys calabaricus]
MSRQTRDGVLNPAYHDSETLQMGRGSAQRPPQQNPYGSTERTYDEGLQASGRQDWDSAEHIPMASLAGGQSWDQQPGGLSNAGYEWDSASDPGGARAGDFREQERPRLRTKRSSILRQLRMRNSSLFFRGALSSSALGWLRLTAEDTQDKTAQEEQQLIIELVAMSFYDRVRAIRQLPVSLHEKKQIRKRVLLEKTSKKGRINWYMDCRDNFYLFHRRCSTFVTNAYHTLQLWQGGLKDIGGKFGSSILSYFLFIKWLLMFSIFSFLVNFGFITVPQLFDRDTVNNGTFKGLELLTGEGYFTQSVLFYGFYTNKSVTGGSSSNSTGSLLPYDMQLAYFFTISVYFVLCCLSLVYSAASSFHKNFMSASELSRSGRLLFSWDFRVSNDKAVRSRQKNLSTQLKELLSEHLQQKLCMTFDERIKRFGRHLLAWFVSSGLAIGCSAAVYFLCLYNVNSSPWNNRSDLTKEASTLLLPIVVSLINLIVPLLYSLLRNIEFFTFPRHELYTLILRNVILKMSIIGVLCYYWLDKVVNCGIPCWETFVGGDIYRLVVIDFFFCLFACFFGEFLHKVIGTRFFPRLGVPEFDIARNVLDLIYAQTLAWIGIYFSPLLPLIQIIKLFLMFYVKKFSLMQNCHPPQRSWRAAQMMTIFILILFFPSYVGVLITIAVIFWRITPSSSCGPFRGLNVPFDVIANWIDSITLPGSQWVVWIYNNLIQSVLFFFILTLLVLILIYVYYQIVVGRKKLIAILRDHIANEGKDKAFLLEKLKKLQSQSMSSLYQDPSLEAMGSKQDIQDREVRGSNQNGTPFEGTFPVQLRRAPSLQETSNRRQPTSFSGERQSARDAEREYVLPNVLQEPQQQPWPGAPGFQQAPPNYIPPDYPVDDDSSMEGGTLPVSDALAQALWARRQAEDEEEEGRY